MKSRKLFASVMIAVVSLAVVVAAGAAAPRQPMALPQVGSTFAAPYDVVWDATLKSLGVLKTPVADKATGRIETEPFSFVFTTGGGQAGGTQVISVSFQINVIRNGETRTDLQVVPQIHHSLLYGFTPGPTNNPWLDLFARIQTRLGTRG